MWNACSPVATPLSESCSSTPAGVCVNEAEPASCPFASLSMALAVSAASTVMGGTDNTATAVRTEAKLTSFMRCLRRPAQQCPRMRLNHITFEIQPCSAAWPCRACGARSTNDAGAVVRPLLGSSIHQAPVNQRCSATLPTYGQPASGPSILTFAREHAEPDAKVGIGPLANDTSGRWTIGNAGRNDCQSSRHEGCVADPKMAFPILRRQRRRPPHQQARRPPSQCRPRKPRQQYPLANSSEQWRS
jgi:hypothetical protein